MDSLLHGCFLITFKGVDTKRDTKGKNCIYVMTHEEITNIPEDCVVTYAHMVFDYKLQKKDPNRVRITVGGYLILYAGKLTAHTADLRAAKLLWNSILSSKGAKFMALHVGNIYLKTPLDWYENMKIPLSLFPQHTIEQYNFDEHAKAGRAYLKIQQAIYGLPQARMLANKQFCQNLALAGYYEVLHTPGLWKHVSRSIQF